MIKVSVLNTGGAGRRSIWTTTLTITSRGFERSSERRARMQLWNGVTPGSPPAFSAMGHLYFDSVEAFLTAFGPHAGEIMGDIPNYTNVQPTIQLSEVKL